jgi:aryl-alcohol dehydrogenase-like predicted oxidoreductase
VVGLGTWLSKPDEVRKAVKYSLEIGYRHLDCAYVYCNEDEVGQGIRESGVPRKDIFITSKVSCCFNISGTKLIKACIALEHPSSQRVCQISSQGFSQGFGCGLSRSLLGPLACFFCRKFL